VKDFIYLLRGFGAKRSGFLIEQTEFSCLPYRLYPVVHAQFGEDMANMAFDGIESNNQFSGLCFYEVMLWKV
jgi:hypothetical protein